MNIKQQTAQMYFEGLKLKDTIAVVLNLSRRTFCRALAEWNEISRALHRLEGRLCISRNKAYEEIYSRLNRLLHLQVYVKFYNN